LTANQADYPAPLGAPHVESFRQGLRELGYVEGQNLQVEYRFAELRFDDLPGLAAELVGLPVEVLVVGDSRAIQPAKQATSTTPTVLVITTDPVLAGHVASLSHPGGNITGLTMAPIETMGKRLEILRETVPGLSYVGHLYSADDRLAAIAGDELGRASETLGLRFLPLPIQGRDDLEPAFERARLAGVDGMFVTGSPLVNSAAQQIAALAVTHRLPTIGLSREVVEAGILMAYAPNLPALYYRAATYVDKILKGTSPAVIPVERPSRFDLILNMRTARALDLRVPGDILQMSTDVVH
jgi:putative ABC transport system substrate-binding protein